MISLHAGRKLLKHAVYGTLLWQTELNSVDAEFSPLAGYSNDTGETLVVVGSKQLGQPVRLVKFDSEGQTVFVHPLSFYVVHSNFEMGHYSASMENSSGKLVINKIVMASDGSIPHSMWSEFKILGQSAQEIMAFNAPYSFGYNVPFLMNAISGSSVLQDIVCIYSPSWKIYKYDITSRTAAKVTGLALGDSRVQ